MKIAFVVNDVTTEKAQYSTTRLARAASAMGHDVFYIGTDEFAFDADDAVSARAHRAPKSKAPLKDYLTAIQKESAIKRIDLGELDAVMLRNDPADDFVEHPYRQSAGIVFGQLAAGRGTLVVNDPLGLSQALNKLYFHAFPPQIRPRTLVTRDPEEIRAFVEQQGGKAILKPLQGSGGQNVFMISKGDAPNLNQMIDAVARDGYVVAQEYLPAAAKGDVRLFVMNGRPLKSNGTYAAFARKQRGTDLRSNMSVGAEAAKVKVTEQMLRIAEVVRPKLIQDGMFFVGLDIVGDKLMEINVFSPGGLGSVKKHGGVDFAPVVIKALEEKAKFRSIYGRFRNTELATM
ncbi:MAG: glutathione synthetase [Actinomycetota bacterium]